MDTQTGRFVALCPENFKTLYGIGRSSDLSSRQAAFPQEISGSGLSETRRVENRIYSSGSVRDSHPVPFLIARPESRSEPNATAKLILFTQTVKKNLQR